MREERKKAVISSVKLKYAYCANINKVGFCKRNSVKLSYEIWFCACITKKLKHCMNKKKRLWGLILLMFLWPLDIIKAFCHFLSCIPSCSLCMISVASDIKRNSFSFIIRQLSLQIEVNCKIHVYKKVNKPATAFTSSSQALYSSSVVSSCVKLRFLAQDLLAQ